MSSPSEAPAVVAAASVAINDQTYELARHTAAWHLTKRDGTRYDLFKGVCNCQDNLYNGKSRAPRTGGCKHMRALRQLGLTALEESTVPQPPPPPSAEEVGEKLAAPFDPGEVQAKPGAINGPNALAMFYVDARAVQDRLDAVLGVDGWEDEYTLLEGGSVQCQLRCRIGAVWVTKSDVGSPGDLKDPGDQMKGAFSDALKRAAVKFGVGRYLYAIDPVWCPYDGQKRKFLKPPAPPGTKTLPPPAGPNATITRDQATVLVLLMEKQKIDLERFYAHYHITRLGELPAARFEDAKKMVKAECSVLKTPIKVDAPGGPG